MYMLDTDTCSYIIKERPPAVLERFKQVAMDEICISIVTYSELRYGVERSSSKKINHEVISLFIKYLNVLDWDKDAADTYARIRSTLESNGTPIGNMDMMIGAHAKSLGATLITNNTKHFKYIDGLSIDNWVHST
ncbi:type II toxin-antitoxin system tRNA(fMet)-specific endonuclease VapC [Spartinivicinus poritis]|uniref:Type II toxin-antitoxin system VapC family toxin n=1 Tax=Spartinivicinus poritis TaxID=2994640 RepID=A0ABT5UGL9_9GAMM|nr:type II toxin-antitoxin system VapC family toxin [Spartinivicinus sp. A2-2]MDE1465528.1 type II toxin-antitoxin system VapC family toxin [Spartinivicinus sp. A2-2]